jgi:alkylation response protein AidB-like acyl-CoA dehydrogenase
MLYQDSQELKILIANLKRFIETELIPLEDKGHIVADDVIPQETQQAIRRRSMELGFWAINMPEKYGGGGLGMFETLRLREEVAKYGRIVPFFVFGGPDSPPKILLQGTEAQKQKYLVPNIRAERTGCFAMTEPNAGSDIHAIETTARPDGDNYVLNGMKHFISNAPYADFAIVVAKTGELGRGRKEITLFIVEKGAPGFSVGRINRTIGGGNFQGELIFEDCIVPKEQVLGGVGGGYALAAQWLIGGQMIISAGCVGVADYLLRASANHARNRVTFGQPLSEREVIQGMIAEMATELFCARNMLYDTAHRLDSGTDYLMAVAMTKLYCTEMAGRAADKAVQIHGGMGCVRDLPIERIYRFVRALRIVEGSSEMQRMTIASLVLGSGNPLFALGK